MDKDFAGHCMTCKHFAQGQSYSFCDHPKASKEAKSYRYYSDSSKNWEEGIHPTRVDYMAGRLDKLPRNEFDHVVYGVKP